MALPVARTLARFSKQKSHSNDICALNVFPVLVDSR